MTGGGAIFLDDAIRRQDADPIDLAAITNRLPRWRPRATLESPVSPVSSASPRVPGGINALNGVFGAWTDSIPMIVVSGQVKREMNSTSYPGLGMRQLGDQEVDIVSS